MKDLTGFVLILVFIGMLTGVGILTLDKFGTAAKSPSPNSETMVISSGSGSLTYDEVLTFTWFGNGTINTTNTDLTINVANAAINWTASGGLTVNADNFSDGSYTAIYTYDKDTAATTQLVNARTALAEIPSTWLTLLITIVILGIIMGVVIKSFSGKGR